MSVLCDQVTQCSDSLRISLVSATSHQTRQKNYGLHTITCAHNIAHMNCHTCPYSSRNKMSSYVPRNKSRIYLHLLISFHFTQVLVLENIWLGIKYTLFLCDCGSSDCYKSRCQTCLNVNNTDVFQRFVTKESYKINHKFDCDSKCTIYLFSCKACELQYVGSTVERFCFRWKNYKNCQREAAQGGITPQSFFTNIL